MCYYHGRRRRYVQADVNYVSGLQSTLFIIGETEDTT